jgi:hypothetical protein
LITDRLNRMQKSGVETVGAKRYREHILLLFISTFSEHFFVSH